MQLFELAVEKESLHTVASSLGADVPFFLSDVPQLATCTGTELRPFPLTLSAQLRVFPQPIHSSTVAAYKALDYTQFDASRDLAGILNQPIQTWKDSLENDLEVPVFEMYPQLAEVKRQLYQQGAIYAAMSGSGSAMLALFDK